MIIGKPAWTYKPTVASRGNIAHLRASIQFAAAMAAAVAAAAAAAAAEVGAVTAAAVAAVTAAVAASRTDRLDTSIHWLYRRCRGREGG